jgi:hypothetical protein
MSWRPRRLRISKAPRDRIRRRNMRRRRPECFPSGCRGRGGEGGGCYAFLSAAAYGDGLLVRGAVVPEVTADADAARDADREDYTD